MKSEEPAFHVVTVGWVDDIGEAIARKGGVRFSYIAHPRHTLNETRNAPPRPGTYFLRDDLQQPMPEADTDLLASLEQEGVPTIYNIILGDPVASTIDYREALKYATFLARRFRELFTQLRPSAVLASFDGMHSGLSFAVAKRMGIPWFALNFSVIPPGLACFCDQQLPTARVQLVDPDLRALRALAEAALVKFETKRMQAPVYLAPPPRSLIGVLKRLPVRLLVVLRTFRRARLRRFLQFTEDKTDLSVAAAVRHLWRIRAARKAVARTRILRTPPSTPYVLFGLHTQPESSIDVWAPFFANQFWVVELLARSIPCSHKLLVKIHKSDAAKYSQQQIERMQSFPGVEIVEPFADARGFIDSASLVVGIQGTMGLEAALLGKPVIMLGDSPVNLFPNATRIGAITDLPALMREKLAQKAPSRDEILNAYAAYMSPFLPAAHNDWTVKKTDAEIEGFVQLFERLKEHLARESQPVALQARS